MEIEFFWLFFKVCGRNGRCNVDAGGFLTRPYEQTFVDYIPRALICVRWVVKLTGGVKFRTRFYLVLVEKQ